MTRTFVMMLAGLALSLAGLVVAQPAQAASYCTASNQPVTDDVGNYFAKRYYCSTYTGSAVYGNIGSWQAGQPLDDTGYMYASSSVWVICQYNGRPNPVIQGNTNTWWLYTQGDVARPNQQGYTHAWGYLPATAVSQGGQNQPVPGVPTCATKY
jgi:hypothetical protein